MILSAALFVVCTALTSPAADTPNADTPHDTAIFSIWAAEAVPGIGERHIDPELNTAKASLIDLPYQNFYTLYTGIHTINPGESNDILLQTGFTLTIHLLSREEDGRAKVSMILTTPPKDVDQPPTRAIDTTMTLVPGKKVRLCGVRLDEGYLVIVISLGGN